MHQARAWPPTGDAGKLICHREPPAGGGGGGARVPSRFRWSFVPAERVPLLEQRGRLGGPAILRQLETEGGELGAEDVNRLLSPHERGLVLCQPAGGAEWPRAAPCLIMLGAKPVASGEFAHAKGALIRSGRQTRTTRLARGDAHGAAPTRRDGAKLLTENQIKSKLYPINPPTRAENGAPNTHAWQPENGRPKTEP